MTSYLVDVNVWVALAVVEHDHHDAALDWFIQLGQDDAVVLCRVTQMGFLRLLTNRRILADDVLTAPEAWRTYDTWASLAGANFALEPPGFEHTWRDMTQHPNTGPNFWTDAYLAAFAKAGGYTVVSFDRGFKQHNVALRLLI